MLHGFLSATCSKWRGCCANAGSCTSTARSPVCRMRAARKVALLVGADAAELERARLVDPTRHHHPAFRRGRHRHGLQADQQFDGRDPDRGDAEGLAIAEQAGLDMKLVLEAVETGVAASPQVIRIPAHGGAEFRRRDVHGGAAPKGCCLCGGAGREPACMTPPSWGVPRLRLMIGPKRMRLMTTKGR